MFGGGLAYCLSVDCAVCFMLCCEFFFLRIVGYTRHGSVYMCEICACYALMALMCYIFS